MSHTVTTDRTATADVRDGWLDEADPDRDLLYAVPTLQRVYRDRVGRVVVEVVHSDQSRATRVDLLPGVPVEVSAGLLIERREARLVDEALARAAAVHIHPTIFGSRA